MKYTRWIFEIYTTLGILMVYAKYTQKYTLAYTRFFAQCVLGDVPHNLAEMSLPTFEDVCLLDQPTLRFIPSKSRPAFARALSSSLRSVILENTEEAWLKLFMLPKCVLPSLRRKGRHDKPLPVDTLCNMWSDDKQGALWSLAKSRSADRNHPGGVSINNRTKVIDQAVSLGRSGMFGKACRVLQSSGNAPRQHGIC